MPKVSIILPVYNVEAYLDESLQCLTNQTLKDIEIICVNDGSTDRSQEILEKYAKQDNRIKIINQPNQGQGTARNNALSSVTGEYIGFADPDDWVSPTMFETLYNTAKADDCDLVEESYTLHNEPRKYIKVINSKLKLPQNKVFDRHVRKNYVFSNKLAVWNKIYKTEFIKRNNIRFMDIPRAEDIIFTVKSRAFATKIKYVDCPDYHYRIKKDNQVIVSKSNETKILNDIDFLINIKQELIQANLYDTILKDYSDWALKKLYEGFRNLNTKDQADYIKSVRDNFSENIYKTFVTKARMNKFLDMVFSIQNITLDEQKYKVFKILGFEIKIKYSRK